MNSNSKIFKEQIKKTEIEYFKNNKWDKWRLKFHLMPPIGWLNDPNGLSYFNGYYNIFFQYSPFEVNGGLKFWGHYKSNNLIDYKYEGATIYPDERFDCHGVYSGSAFVEDDILYLYYTGNVKLLGKHDYINSGRESNTLLITTKDAVNFSEKICLMEMKDFPDFITNHIRDPKVWKKDNIYYMVQGVRKNTNMGAVLIFSSNDKINWKYLNCIDSDKEFGYMWECPDLFEIEGQNILITCPQGVPQKKNIYENIYLSGYFLIDDDYRNGDIKVSNFTVLDRGFDFYAPQTFLDEYGNRTLIGWMGVPDTEETHKNLTVEYGWQHCLTIPRELTLKNKKLFQNPHRNLYKLRNGVIIKREYDKNEISSNLICDNMDSYEALISLENLNNDNNNNFQFIISEGLCGKYKNGKFILEFINDIGGGRKNRSCYLEYLNNLRIFVDTSAVEIFINDGETVFSTRYYPNNNSFKICGSMHIEICKLNGFKIDYNI